MRTIKLEIEGFQVPNKISKVAELYFSEDNLYEEIERFLESQGVIRSRYQLGQRGDEEDRVCLCRKESFWIVYSVERGTRTVRGVFPDYHAAVDYFVWWLIQPNTIDWKAVIKRKQG